MNLKSLSLICAIACGCMAPAALAEAQKIEYPAPSPPCTIKQRVGLTDIDVSYSRPSVKDREIYGGMVPYGKVWRTGANSATKVVFSTPVKVSGTEVPAGTYGLFTIPGKDEWTVIFNKGADQWGAYKYDEKADVARVKVTPVKLNHKHETFTIEFDDIRDDSATMDIAWDKVEVPVKLQVDIVSKLVAETEAVMASDQAKKPYFPAAAFYYNHGQDLHKALKWVDTALAEREAHYMLYVKAEILAKLGEKKEAIAAANRSSELAEKSNDFGYVKLNADLIKSLQ